MSQLINSPVAIPSRPRPPRTAWIGALLALVAAVAVALAIALSGGSSHDAAPVGVQAQPSLRVDGGPEEAGVAAAVGSRAAPAPSESAVAAAIGASSPQGGSAPDESRVAAAISAR